MKIGVVGFSSDSIDHAAAYSLLASGIDRFASQCSDPDEVEIVSGLTNLGVPAIAYQIADEKGYTTIGITAEKALNLNCGLYPVDKQIIVGQEFGDESEYFVSYIDCLVRVGGGEQSHSEVRLFIEKCARENTSASVLLYEAELSLLE